MAMIDLAGNLPPNVTDTLLREYRTAAARSLSSDAGIQGLQRHQFNGEPEDREAGSRFVAIRLGERPDPSRIVITNGTQSALIVLLHRLVGQRGTLAVERLTYPAIGRFSKMIGFDLAAIAMDEDGLCPDAFETVCQTRRPAALYTTATLQNPTTAILSQERRARIAEIARHYDVQIIEDDIYSLLPQSVPPPLAHYAPERTWYILGTAKGVTAALKIAYLVCPSPADPSRLFWPGFQTTFWMCAPANILVATDLIDRGGMAKIIDAVRAETCARQGLVTQILDSGGMRSRPDCLHVWLHLPDGMDSLTLHEDLRADGVLVNSGTEFALADSEPVNAIRFGLGKARSRSELREAIERISSKIK